ncbi:magnesium transporter [Devosia epidermidihirudinis]|uniref:Magnesium transport protein CorA n=1 Tax=Devosia epidermidihirudinis TaxID=1293439 RepID=A0A0F5Q405_9HYPH|nr:magnesium transporter CorA family protein [Devosia epidermidihirudinis]KKC35627.1 magnesium transporter [Devosia epidermidihirudinis]
MLRIFTHNGQHLVAATIEGQSAPESYADAIWYDLFNPTRDEELLVERCLGIAVPTRDEMQDIEPSARLYAESGAEFMTVTTLSHMHEHDPVKAPVTFILRDKVLVTLRYSEPTPFATFQAAAQRPNGRAYVTGELVMVGLLEALIDRLAQVLEWAGDELDGISRGVFRSTAKNAVRKARNLEGLIEKIGNKGDMLTLVRESLVSIQRLTTFHQARDMSTAKTARELRQELKVLQRDAEALGDHAGFLSNKVNFLLDATLGLINLEQNAIIKIFSVAAVVFLPPTLVASIYGMNFEAMPELALPYGYPLALGAMVASAVLPYLFFKKRGWL